ncbi:unnamed protein product [Rotaria sp. Silwood1]|nr:unnamed protein product [Rotaria sp. Silwood1]CAF5041807.1 unnamed protein product [Rotaria sp. Silwood1]
MTSHKFIKHFRDLQAGENEKAGAAETLAYLNGELSFQEYEKRVREVNTDYSNVSVGKILNTRETEIVDIDKLIDELSDIDDLSGLSSSIKNKSPFIFGGETLQWFVLPQYIDHIYENDLIH